MSNSNLRNWLANNYGSILKYLFCVFVTSFIALILFANYNTGGGDASNNVSANVSVTANTGITANVNTSVKAKEPTGEKQIDFDGFWGGFWTEIIVGGLFSLIAVLFTSYIYLAAKRGKYYDDIVDFVNEIIKLRKNMEKTEEGKEEKNGIDKDQIQNLIISFSKTIPDEILAYTLDKNVTAQETPAKCKICTKTVNKTTSGKCRNCRLDCQAWEHLE